MHLEYFNTVFAIEENGCVFGKRKVDVIQDNFLISVQRNVSLIKCWLMNTLKTCTETQQATFETKCFQE